MNTDTSHLQTHMSSDEFRALGRQFIDWVIKYLDDAEHLSLKQETIPGDVRAALPQSPPMSGEKLENAIADLDSTIIPGLTHWQSPNWFSYFPCNHSYPSILGELVSAGIGIQGMLWATSPACTEVESLMMDWMLEALGLPDKFRTAPRDNPRGQCPGGGVIQDTASSATLCALLAARDRLTDGVAGREGMAACPHLVAYTSEHAHSSVEKSCAIAGIGRQNLRLIETDDEFRMCPKALAQAIEHDIAEGRVPFFVCATAGTTASGAVDPTDAIADVCEPHGIWIHLDGAMYGIAALAPEYRWVFAGAERCDSICANPHKWMFTNFDCDLFWVADRSALTRALGIMPEYLRNQPSETGQVIDYRDWQVPLGRRFRALKLWFVLRHYGIEGLQTLIREHVAMAQECADMVDADEHLERVCPTPLSIVTLAHVKGDEATESIMHAINDSGKARLSHARVGDRYVIRIAIGQSRSTLEHVHQLMKLLSSAAREV